jgi:FAD/FMN-containing dehydrogenase
MITPGFVEVSGDIVDELGGIAGTENVVTDPAGVETFSKDYYWYSPVLLERLGNYRASVAVKVCTLDTLKEVVSIAVAHGLPVTLRGAATGNYGQCIPLCGGVVIDLSGMDRLLSIEDGVATAEPGTRLVTIENAARAAGWELRCYPSTWMKASLGGFIAGGTGGIGSVMWGTLRDNGTIKRLKILTIEAEPRILDLEEAEALKAFHTYGTNGIIVEVELRLAPARRWDQVVVAGPDWAAVRDFADSVAFDDKVPKRLLSAFEHPVPSYFKPIRKFYPEGQHVAFLEVDEAFTEEIRRRAEAHGVAVSHVIAHTEPRRSPMLSDYTWNHTTLWAIKADPQLTYLQVGFADNYREQLDLLKGRYPAEFLLHIEYMRMGTGKEDKMVRGGAPLVRYTTEERLKEIMDYCAEIGVGIANPHSCYLEDFHPHGDFSKEYALKAEADPKGLLNPGKLRFYPGVKAPAGGAWPRFPFNQ